MEFKEITNKLEWEGFLGKCGQKSFLCSWAWGEFQILQGFKIKRLGAVDNSGLRAVVLAVKIKARRGTYILIQHGPNFIETNQGEIEKILKELFFELKKWAKEEGASFIRCAPLLERSRQNLEMSKAMGFRKAPMHANAYEATWKLDIGLSEEDLFKGMRKTTRYLIRQAQKNPDITIEQSTNPADIAIYQGLNRNVGERQKFAAFSDEYIKREFELFAGEREVSFFFGKYQNEIAAGSMVVFWQDTAYYHQAASLGKFAKYSIPYLLQWEAVKAAKARGCKRYDFWGYIDPKTDPKHPWAGPTLFKMGFGGGAYEYLKTMDLPLSWKYWPVFIFENLRKLKRGL
ncbi:MAG: peptidoglycan bridge formation glycyltransferase FemA/FemB family protein [Candidatus Paceibacterota bacterium]